MDRSPETTPLSALRVLHQAANEMRITLWTSEAGSPTRKRAVRALDDALAVTRATLDAARGAVPAADDRERRLLAFVEAVESGMDPNEAVGLEADWLAADIRAVLRAGVSPSTGWKPATAKGTAIGEDEWGRPLHVWTGSPSTGDDRHYYATEEQRRIEQAFIDGSVEGSPIDHDGNPKENSDGRR
jgi:hypothetical protein